MSQRLLRTLRIKTIEHNELFQDTLEVRDIQIWSSRSKVVNENMKLMGDEVTYVNIVNPVFTPIWSIIDKPYNVYTSNQKTLKMFERLANYSELETNVITNAILSKITQTVYILFYIEKSKDTFTVKCILLDLDLQKLKEILLAGSSIGNNHFIDEQVNDNEDLIDTLLKQRTANFSSLNNKAQATLSIKEQQLKRSSLRQSFKKMITSEVRRRMGDKPKALQTEVADLCLRAANFKYRDLLEMDEKMKEDILQWLHILMSTLGT